MTYDSRTRPHHLRPADSAGDLVTPGTYGLEVVTGGPFGVEVDAFTPVVGGLTSADGSVTINDNGDGTLDLAAAAGGGGGSLIGCKAVLATSAPLTSSTSRTVPLDGTDVWDTASIHSPTVNNTRLTVPVGKGGVWKFVLSITMGTNTTGHRMVFPYVNGVPQAERIWVNAGGGSSTVLTMPVDLLLAAGDYVELGAFASFSSGSVSVTAASMSGQLVG